MENKNTSTSTVITGLSDYLKRSELPKNVSSFRNDANYVSEGALNNWMKEHSYIDKNDINILINDANSKVINNINSDFSDSTALLTLQSTIDALTGEVEELKKFSETNIQIIKEGYISIDKESNFATKNDIDQLIVDVYNVSNAIPSLKGYATQSWVEGKGYLTAHQDISNKADKSYVDEKIDALSFDIPSLDGYATQSWVEGKGYLIAHQDISGKADKSYVDEKIAELSLDSPSSPSLENYATKSWVENKGYLTTHQDISGKTNKSYVDSKIASLQQSISKKASTTYVNDQISALREEIPNVVNMSGYATQSWVEGKGYVTSTSLSNTLTKYAKANNTYDKKYIDNNFIDRYEITDYIKKEEVEKTYLPKKDIANTYLTKKDANITYLSKEDYRGLKSAATISDTYIDKTYNDILNDLNKGYTLLDGFYITNDNDGNQMFALIKNNKLQITQGGNLTIKPEWQIEE